MDFQNLTWIFKKSDVPMYGFVLLRFSLLSEPISIIFGPKCSKFQEERKCEIPTECSSSKPQAEVQAKTSLTGISKEDFQDKDLQQATILIAVLPLPTRRWCVDVCDMPGGGVHDDSSTHKGERKWESSNRKIN